MKWKQITITFLACVMIFAAGMAGFLFLYQMLFQPKIIIEDDSQISLKWQADQDMYEKEILYPYHSWMETGKLVEAEEKYLFSELRNINPNLYTSAGKLAGLFLGEDSELDNVVVNVYDFKADATEYNRYDLRQILYLTQIQNKSDELFIVVDKNDMPVHCQYCAEKNDSELDSPINQLPVMYENLPSELITYAAEIDTVLEEKVYIIRL